jgi:formylglycine-generating enzyme required for sulfatase activity
MSKLRFLLPILAVALACSAYAQNVGTTFCNPTNNSTGNYAILTGTAGSGVGSNLHIEVTQGVPNQIGYLLVGNENLTSIAISNGLLCMTGTPAARVYRFNVVGGNSNSIGFFDANGVLQNLAGTSTTGTGFDVPNTIPNTVPISIMSGDTWHFQLWHRDTPAAQGSSNFSEGLSVTFPVLTPSTPIAGMVQIPAGSFDMGSNEPNVAPYFNSADQQPVHNVTISEAFWMGATEVTQADYEALMGFNPATFSGPNLPVESVSWLDARSYCVALTAQELAAGNLQAGYEYRLPTEAEWEYACRAGTTTEFSTGTDLFCTDAQSRYSLHSGTLCSNSGTIAVGSFPANGFGLFDMHGNVYEWCLDSYEDYSAGALTDPFVRGTLDRTLRGGGWDSVSDFCRSADRSRGSADNSVETIGFRVVLAKFIDPFVEPVSGMVLIPAGSFDMGSSAANTAPYFNNADQQPVHNVTISEAFWMGSTHVTQAEYQTLMGTNPSTFSGANLPVETVSWDDARAYCAALTAQEQVAGNLTPGYVYRLPTEAEWEYACRANTTTEFNIGPDLFCADALFGFSQHSNSSCGANSTTDVGSYAANDFGLYDMHGNVFDWCLDRFSLYGASSATDPLVQFGSERVIRGGSWNFNSNNSRSATRFSTLASNTNYAFGFRVVLAKLVNPFPAPVPTLALIPAGTFNMGSNASSGSPYYGGGREVPVHSVTISQDYWMGVNEVTQAQYLALMNTNPSASLGMNFPVDSVNWDDARAYCMALTAQEQTAGTLPPGYEFRLPTEAEWEYACRAGTTTEFNVGAELFCADANIGRSNHSGILCLPLSLVDVGSYPSNAFGLYDMHGSVFEWCLDSFAWYVNGALTDPLATGGSIGIVRGGAWSHMSYRSRSAARFLLAGEDLRDDVGFRVVLGLPLDPFAPPGPIAGMVSIPSGSFDMGSNAAAGAPYLNVADAQPVHNVTISQDFWMGEHEVTQAEYSAITGVTPSSFSGVNLPVETVSWQDAVAYCTALTAQQAGLGNLPAGMEYRLPTEAEWEYACRAGTTTEFNVGADLFCADSRFGFSYHSNSSCGVSSTIAVGSYAANAFGLYDMHGNVWEWCLDTYAASYSATAVTDPFVTGAPTRIVRGGSWDGPSSPCRSAFRNSSTPGFSGSSVGFRVVLAEIIDIHQPVSGMVLIPAGSFDMGSNAAAGSPYFGEANSQPVHNVTISQSFWMGKHEVTQAEYQVVMGTNPSSFADANKPVETVSWNDALAYCSALTAQETAFGNVPAGMEYRLPTEAEWEYACRAGTTTEFSIGADLFCADARFWSSQHSGSSCGIDPLAGTTETGSYTANAFGLYDMHGNVWEWCLDTYANYSSAAVTDPFVSGGANQVLRGGSWGDVSSSCRSAHRNNSSPSYLNGGVGFRVVLADIIP